MAGLRKMVVVGALVAGATFAMAAPASAAVYTPPNGTVTPGQCVFDGGGDVNYNVGPHGYADGHGKCVGGRYNGRQLDDHSGGGGLA